MTRTKTTILDEAVINAHQRLRAVEHEYETACRLAFPAGRTIGYRHGDSLRYATVVDHGGIGSHTQLKVRGAGQSEYWLYANRVIDELNP